MLFSVVFIYTITETIRNYFSYNDVSLSISFQGVFLIYANFFYIFLFGPWPTLYTKYYYYR